MSQICYRINSTGMHKRKKCIRKLITAISEQTLVATYFEVLDFAVLKALRAKRVGSEQATAWF